MSESTPEPSIASIEWSDRVFLNLLFILKGVAIGYGAVVALAIVRSGPPWRSVADLSQYIAWTATTTLALLTFVSQAFGSARSPLHPTTPVMVVSVTMAVSEFLAYGFLETLRSDGIPAAWFFAIMVNAGCGVAITSAVLSQSSSDRHPYTSLTSDHEPLVRGDRRGALGVGVLALVAGLVATHMRDERWTAVGATLLLLVISFALGEQQGKTGVGVGGIRPWLRQARESRRR